MKKIPTIFTMAFVLVVVTLSTTLYSAPEVTRITKEELKEKLGNADVVVIDVRTGRDWNKSESKIKGAVREGPNQVDTWMEKYPKEKTLIFYCA